MLQWLVIIEWLHLRCTPSLIGSMSFCPPSEATAVLLTGELLLQGANPPPCVVLPTRFYFSIAEPLCTCWIHSDGGLKPFRGKPQFFFLPNSIRVRHFPGVNIDSIRQFCAVADAQDQSLVRGPEVSNGHPEQRTVRTSFGISTQSNPLPKHHR